MRFVISCMLISFCSADAHSVAASVEKITLACPPVMAHLPVKEDYPGWAVYSNKPLRLTGADIEFVVESHLEATLDPDRTTRLNDADLSTVSVFNLLKHRSDKPFTLACHYGDHAQLSRSIPDSFTECTIVQHGRITDDGEFKVFCQ
jgi:hypothetical protein